MYMNMKKKTQSGFTIIELMVVVAVAAALAVFAVPNLTVMVKNNRIATQANDLVGAMNIARSEAVKRALQANVCARATDTSCAAANATDWSNGWIVYLDTNLAAGNTLGVLDAGDTILRVREPLTGNNTMTSSDGVISYRASGFSTLATGSTQSFVLCDDRGNQFGRIITVLNTGRTNMQKTTDQCS